ncbi:hypothetical protein J4E90_010316 [Alternaria incomplexa]|uniref:uncharacterized protein n=1 Tax=Alternaria incomplexa TaxID=1187928 RepID=UPI002220BB61|nr:uncharacterized protein J4E90_010316 [Alternaria incomplexa]KAI4906628.1 hypothetical protein J4E90_010316 [Alternaria incomplexa]
MCKEEVVAFEMKDENWQAGEALLPDSLNAFGAVRSHKSPDLRYAATGFYAERGVELAIAQSANEFSGAFDRLQAQDGGMLIA